MSESFADRLRDKVQERREEYGESARYIAKEKVGISHAALSYFQSGNRIPKPATMERLARALGVSRTWLETGQGHQNPNAWIVGNRALFEVDGVLADWDGSVDADEAERVQRAFYRGFHEYSYDYRDVSPTVHVIFENLFARVMHSLRRRGDDISDPCRRGRLAGELFLDCHTIAKKDEPKTGFDKKPWSTRAWLSAIVGKMEAWEDGRIPQEFEK